jgi:lipopolysaccharide transport system ATP-binding protein
MSNQKDLAINVEGISKKYFIGGKPPFKDIRENLNNAIKSFSKYFTRNGKEEENTFWALKDISFQIKWGEVVGIIGVNGSGKSTLLKILSRITEPTEGHAEIYGRTGSLLEVGSGFHHELTGRENIYFNGSILGMKQKEIDKNFDSIVDFADVEKFVDTPVKHYSSGMYVRLAFAVAAHLNPEIMIIDEILAVGDLEFQRKCIDRMKKISTLGKTVLVVSHSMSTVKSLCTRAIMLERGKLKLDASVDEVIKSYTGQNKVDLIEKIIGDSDYIIKGDRINIKRIKLLNGVQNSFSIYWKQQIDILLEMEVLKETQEISFGCGIKKVDDTLLFTVHHDDITNNRWKLAPGRYNINFTIINDFKPGIYKLCLGAHHQHYRNILFYLEAVNIEVLDYDEKGASPLIYNQGLINGFIKWNDPVAL